MFAKIKKYPYLSVLIFSIILAVVLHFLGVFANLIQALGILGYASAFLAGIFFATSFAGAPAAFYFVNLGESLDPTAVVILGALGAMCSDLLMYRFVKDGFFSELKLISTYVLPSDRLKTMEKITKKRIFVWLIPFLASFFIASPLPDELGVSLFGLINFKPKYLSLITFLLNAVGIFALVFLGNAIVN